MKKLMIEKMINNDEQLKRHWKKLGDKFDITIIAQGEVASGKTWFLHQIISLFKNSGFNIEYICEHKLHITSNGGLL
jgi:hypothetical protein